MNRESKYLLPPECRYSSSRRVRARPVLQAAPRQQRAQPPAPRREVVDESQPVAQPEFLVAPRFSPAVLTPPRVPAIPGALNISELAGNEIVAIGVVGSILAQTTTGDIAALAAGGGGGSTQTYVKLDNLSSYTLIDGASQDQRVGIKDNLRRASAANPIVINGRIDGGTSLPINIAGTALEFVWDVPSNTWMVF